MKIILKKIKQMRLHAYEASDDFKYSLKYGIYRKTVFSTKQREKDKFNENLTKNIKIAVLLMYWERGLS